MDSQALIVTYLPDYQWYKRYYKASLKILEYDPRREVCWSIVTDGKVAESLHLYEFSLKLYLWNESKVSEENYRNLVLSLLFYHLAKVTLILGV